MQVSQAIDEYRYSVLGLSQKYQTWTHQKLEIFASWCQASQLELVDIRNKQFQLFLHEIRSTPSAKTGKLLSSYTVHGYAQTVKVFLKWVAQQEGYEEQITERRVNGMKLPRVDQKIIETFSPDQINLLLDACKKDRYPDLRQRNRLMILLMLDTGFGWENCAH